MKKSLLLLAALTLALAPAPARADSKTVTVGASPTPHAEILKVAAEVLKDQGYTLKIVEYSDYVQPNLALDSKDLDANFFQHKPYLDDFNKEKGTKLVSLGTVHYEPFGIYAGKCSNLAELKDGGMVAVCLKNALSTGGFTLQTTQNGKGQVSVELTGHVSIDAQDTMPMEFYSAAPSED